MSRPEWVCVPGEGKKQRNTSKPKTNSIVTIPLKIDGLSGLVLVFTNQKYPQATWIFCQIWPFQNFRIIFCQIRSSLYVEKVHRFHVKFSCLSHEKASPVCARSAWWKMALSDVKRIPGISTQCKIECTHFKNHLAKNHLHRRIVSYRIFEQQNNNKAKKQHRSSQCAQSEKAKNKWWNKQANKQTNRKWHRERSHNRLIFILYTPIYGHIKRMIIEWAACDRLMTYFGRWFNKR